MDHLTTTIINDITLQTAQLNVSESTIQLVSEEVENRFVLVGKVIGKQFSFKAIRESLSRSWRLRHGFDIKKDSPEVFIFTFNSEADMDWVWKGRPWCVSNFLLALQEWPQEKALDSIEFSLSPFWVRISGLPANQINKSNFHSIGSLFEGLATENTGEADSMKGYGTVRLRVLIRLDKPLKRGIHTTLPNGQRKWIEFSYERLPEICYMCGVIGHFGYECDAKEEEIRHSGGSLNPAQLEDDDKGYGPWMRVGFVQMGRYRSSTGNGGGGGASRSESGFGGSSGDGSGDKPKYSQGLGIRGIIQGSEYSRQIRELSGDKISPVNHRYEVGNSRYQAGTIGLADGKDKGVIDKEKGGFKQQAQGRELSVIGDSLLPLVQGKGATGPFRSPPDVGQGSESKHNPDILKACDLDLKLKRTQPATKDPSNYKKMELDLGLLASSPSNLLDHTSTGILCNTRVPEELGLLHLPIPNPEESTVKDVFQQPSSSNSVPKVSQSAGGTVENSKQEGSSLPILQPGQDDNPSYSLASPTPLFQQASLALPAFAPGKKSPVRRGVFRKSLKARARQGQIRNSLVVTEERAVESGTVENTGGGQMKRNRAEEGNGEAKKICVNVISEVVEGTSRSGPQNDI